MLMCLGKNNICSLGQKKKVSVSLNIIRCQHQFICCENYMVTKWIKHVLFSVIISFETTESLPLNCSSLTDSEVPMEGRKKEEYPLAGVIPYLCLRFLSGLKSHLRSNCYSLGKGKVSGNIKWFYAVKWIDEQNGDR